MNLMNSGGKIKEIGKNNRIFLPSASACRGPSEFFHIIMGIYQDFNENEGILLYRTIDPM